MSFALFLLYLVLTFVRPGEQDPSLASWRWMEVASGLALGAAAVAVATGRGPTFRSAQLALAFAFWTWALISVVASPSRSDTALDDVLGFAKGSGVAFLLVVLNVVSVARLRIVAVVLTILALFVVGQGAAAYHLGIGAERFLVRSEAAEGSSSDSDAVSTQRQDETSPTQSGELARIRGLGYLRDPNDLACTLVAVLPLSFALRRRGAFVNNALLSWIPAGGIVYGIYLTRSRGGILALAGVLALLVRERVGRTLSIVAGAGALMALMALGFLGGRSMSIDQSAEGRIEAWSAGLQMLKSSPIWGVGFGMFTEHNDRVAHNSFVHCFAELGLVGYLLWLSLIMVTLDDMRSVFGETKEETTPLRVWAGAVAVSLLGFLIGGVFLSRSYDVMLFILLGLGAAVADLARRKGHVKAPRGLLVWTYLVSGAAIASIILVWLYMRLVR